jgi:DNA excision repair protein ERCC-1
MTQQRLNPILECIRNVSKEFGDIVPDFQLGRTTCALFLRCVTALAFEGANADIEVEVSLKYHRLHPEYIHQRIQKLGNSYNLRILLLMCDVVSPVLARCVADILSAFRASTKIPSAN